MIDVVFKILEHGLGIYDTYQSRKHLNHVINLRRKYENEMSKDESERDNVVLDTVYLELRIIANSYSQFGKPKLGD